MRGTINGSLGAEFEKFQRMLVEEFLSWQAALVREYSREDQFITHNFDFEWKGYSYGVQPDVDHYRTAKCLSIAGVDIYHPTQDDLTANEIAFGGDMTRSLSRIIICCWRRRHRASRNGCPIGDSCVCRLTAISHPGQTV